MTALPATTLLNGGFHRLTTSEVADDVVHAIRTGERGWLSTVNVAILMMMRSDPALQRFVDRSRWTVADGQPLVWASRVVGSQLPERVTGVDLVDILCARAARDGFGVYLLGADDATVTETAQTLRSRHPGLDVRGATNGYFSADEAADRADAVAGSGAGLLFVAMGVPRQERFIEAQWDRLGATVAVGVGGSFEVICGRRSRAPRWMQRLGLEWLYRLVQEPRRLFYRYLVTNSQFLGLMLRQLATALPVARISSRGADGR